MICVRTSRRRKQRLLRLLVQSSTRPRVLVPGRLVVLLPAHMGQVRWQETWLPGCLRLQHRRRSKSPLTHVFCPFLQSCVRESSRTRLRRECNYMPLRACTFLASFYFRVCTLCSSCPFLLSSVHTFFHNLECARPRALRDIKKQFICRTNLGAAGDPLNVILENELLRRHALVGC